MKNKTLKVLTSTDMDVRGVTLPEILANWLKSTVDAMTPPNSFTHVFAMTEFASVQPWATGRPTLPHGPECCDLWRARWRVLTALGVNEFSDASS